MRLLPVILFAAWLVYNFMYDETRKGHPNYKKNRHESCLIAAREVANSRLEEAIADPSSWMLAGYKSASDMAKTSYNATYQRCMN